MADNIEGLGPDCDCGWMPWDESGHEQWCRKMQIVNDPSICCSKDNPCLGHRSGRLPIDPWDLYDNDKPMPETKPSNPKDLIGSDKLPLSLVPGTTKAYIALGHLEGHLKYGLCNWRECGVKMSIYLDALERHIEKLKGGEWEDQQTQVPHLANAITCLSIIIDAYECGKLIDDRPKAAPVAGLIDRFSEKVKHLKKLFGKSKPVDYFMSGPKERE